MTFGNDVTLFAVACTKIPDTIKALRECQKYFTFKETLLFTHEPIQEEGIFTVKIERLDYKEYNRFVFLELGKYIHTPFSLLVQNDGYILRPEKWTDEFYNYDYIGSPWPPNMHFTPEGEEVRVGNGGFSWRSKKLLDMPMELNLPFTDGGKGFWHEDGNICNYHRKRLEDNGIKFAPVNIAAQFASELVVPETVKAFGFHRYK